MHPLCKILNTPVMSICVVKQNDGTWVEKDQRFLFNVYKRFFLFLSSFLRFLTFFIIFFSGTFFLHL